MLVSGSELVESLHHAKTERCAGVKFVKRPADKRDDGADPRLRLALAVCSTGGRRCNEKG